LLRVFCYWLAIFIFIKKMRGQAFGVAMIVEVVPRRTVAEISVDREIFVII